MKTILYQLQTLLKSNNENSHATRGKRKEDLTLSLKQLIYELNYPDLRLEYLKPKHIVSLVEHWQSQGTSISTIKSRLSHLRWLTRKIGKQNIMPRTNDKYGIEKRVFVTNVSKGREITDSNLSQIKDEYILASIHIMRAFGLRREESIKFIPKYADKGDHIQLKDTWCKGGKARVIPIVNESQRQALDHARSVAGFGSLIPSDINYIKQRGKYDYCLRKAGLKKLHGLRHRYAENRYKELTGWNPPTLGGPRRKALTPKQKRLDKEVRLIISRELGHERISIVANYIGS